MADSIYYQLSRYTQLPIIILGSIGAILNQILFFYRKPLRVTSCSSYFRALSINDLLVLYLYVLLQWLADQYGIDPTLKYNWYCKIKSFLTTSLYTLSPYLVVMACFDRLCTSSRNIRFRHLATHSSSIDYHYLCDYICFCFVYLYTHYVQISTSFNWFNV